MKIEIWKQIEGLPSYEVSDQGNVRSKKKGYLTLKPQKQTGGYLKFTFWEKGLYTQVYAHKLVLEAFVSKRPEGFQACHMNGNKKDNRLENLAWDSPSENQSHRFSHGTAQLGKKRKVVSLKPEDVFAIRRCLLKHAGNKTKASAEMGLSRTTVSDIANGRTWSKLK